MKEFFKKVFGFLKTHKLITIVTAVIMAAVLVLSHWGALLYTRRSVGVVPTDEDLKNAVVYDRVLFFGVDGAGNYFKDIDTPNFDRIFGEGSINYYAWSQYPTTSAHNWTSSLHGVRYQKHGVNNLVAKRKKYSKTKYPSVFKVYADAHPEDKMISLTAWYPLNYGCIEDLDNLIKYSGPNTKKTPEDDKFLEKEDIRMKNTLIKEIQEGLDPKIAFMYFAEVDEIGHEYGRRGDKMKNAIMTVDDYLGEVYDAYAERGWLESTLFVFMTDHGHRYFGGHGNNSKQERTVTIAVAGAKGNIIKGSSGKAVTQDVASIILYGLGIKQPDTWESKVPYNIFTTLPNA